MDDVVSLIRLLASGAVAAAIILGLYRGLRWKFPRLGKWRARLIVGLGTVFLASGSASLLTTGGAQAADVLEPAVSIAKSVTPEYLVCLEDGRKLKMLKRYLRSRYDMTPEEYRARWNLPADYPMVASNYAKLRSQHAKDIGLGKKRSADT